MGAPGELDIMRQTLFGPPLTPEHRESVMSRDTGVIGSWSSWLRKLTGRFVPLPEPHPGGGLKSLLLSSILYAPGTLLYVQVRREQNKPVLVGTEWIVLAAATVGCLLGIYGVATGHIVI